MKTAFQGQLLALQALVEQHANAAKYATQSVIEPEARREGRQDFPPARIGDWIPDIFFFAFIPRCVLILKRAENVRKGGYSASWLPYGLLPSVLFLACVKRFASVLFVFSGPTP